MVNSNQTNPSSSTEQNQSQQSSTQMYPSVELVKKVMPNATEANIAKNLPFVLREMAANKLTSRNQLVAMMATIEVETGSFAYDKEIGGENQRYAPYYGRGYIQLTWKRNYKAAGEKLGIDLVGNPELARQPEIAAKTTLLYWMGKQDNHAVAPYAEKGDWYNVRSVVNRGQPGKQGRHLDRFQGTIQRGLQNFQTGIDPNAVGALPGNYGMGCIDTGGAPNHNADGVNPSSMGDALAYALGLYESSRQSIILKALLDIHGQPDILNLDAQTSFEVKGFGEKLDGKFVVEEITFYGGDSLSADLLAKMPDPDAPPPQVFRHDTNAPLSDPAVSSPQSGAIPGRIIAAAMANKGQSSRSGPRGGREACAWALGKFCIIPAGLQKLGDGPYGSDAVDGVLAALRGGRGQKIPLNEVVAGDIWAVKGRHIGVFIDNGKTVLSNSSSKASFSWVSPLGTINSYYGASSNDDYWRVLS